MHVRYIAALLLLVSQAVTAAPPFSALYVFGDSLSDTGNLASIRGDFPAPFYQNRVSNGPVAVDILAQRLGLSAQAAQYLLGRRSGGNYAVAGAKASGNDLIDLPSQVVMFLAQHRNDAPADALYVVFIGGNDVRAARGAPDVTTANAAVDDAVSEVAENVVRLIRAGARALLVMNSPDLGLLPETRRLALERNDPLLARRATQLSERYAAQLSRALGQIQQEHAKVWLKEIDIYRASRGIAQHAAQLGIDNVADACFNVEAFTFHPNCAGGAAFDRFYFFDEIHPTAKVHRLIGEGIYREAFEEHSQRVARALAAATGLDCAVGASHDGAASGMTRLTSSCTRRHSRRKRGFAI